MKRLVVVILTIAMLVTSIYVPMFNVSATIATGSGNVTKEIAEEGNVLLKNNSALPLAAGEKIALFGSSQNYAGYTNKPTKGWAIGGGGSSTALSDSNNVIDPYEALTAKATEGKVSIYNALSAAYKADSTYSYVPDATMYASAAANADTAIMFISRYSTEGGNRVESDWYLSQAEKDMLTQLNNDYDKVIVVANIGGAMDTSWVDNETYGADALIISWYPGEAGGTALANIMTGDVNPSGKLADTFTKNLDAYVNVISNLDQVNINFEEDIFVGYRYFETFAKDDVQYPFGYGLSYTNFELSNQTYNCADGKITVSVDVKNTGTVAGKEVVQVYFSAPQKTADGTVKLSKSAVELAGFAKTGLITPGATETVSVTYDVADMSSYDDMGLTGRKSAYVLEAGDYKVYVGNSAREAQTRLAGTYTQSAISTTEQLTQLLVPKSLSKQLTVGVDVSGTISEVYNTQCNNTSYTIPTAAVPTTVMGDGTFNNITMKEVMEGKATVEELVGQMTIDELASFASAHDESADLGVGKSMGSVGGNDAVTEKYKIARADTANGPMGFMAPTPVTAFPCTTMAACTWNKELMTSWGEQLGKEAILNNVDIMLGPGVNIHRHPFNGRNFEYFSEDPLLTAEMVTKEAEAILKNGVTLTIKHFAAYNSEKSRTYTDSRASERALREIYLKAFERPIKALKDYPLSLMTSYNKINGTWAGERIDLMRDILRNEWGFKGFAMSDWGTRYDTDGNGNFINANSIIAGCNMLMTHNSQSNPNLVSGLEAATLTKVNTAVANGSLNRATLESNAADVIKVITELPDAEIKNEVAENVALGKTPLLNYYSYKPVFKNDWTVNNASCITDGKTDNSFYYDAQSTITIDLGKLYNVEKVEVTYGKKSTNSGTYANIRALAYADFNPIFTKEYSDGTAFGNEVGAWYEANKNDVNYGVLGAGTVGGGETVSITKDAKARYITLNKASGTTGLDIAEIKVYSKDLDDNNTIVNAMPNSRIYTSSSYTSTSSGNYYPDSLTDNNLSTQWASRDRVLSMKGRLVVDLGKEVPIYMIDFVPGLVSGHRKNYSVYVTNDNEFVDMVQLKTFDATTDSGSGKLYRLMPYTDAGDAAGKSFRYVVAQSNGNNTDFGLAEMKVWAERKNLGNNSIINVSKFSNAIASASYGGTTPKSITDHNADTWWASSQGGYSSEQYVYVDLGEPRKLDSVSLVTDTSSAVNAAVTNIEDLRTDFQIIASNKAFTNASVSDSDAVIVNHTDVLAKGAGNSSSLCVFEVPDKYKNNEYRYVGIKKKPSQLNHNVGQMIVSGFDVYSKTSNYETAFAPLLASYNKDSKTVTVNAVSRISKEPANYKLIQAYYDRNNVLYNVSVSDFGIDSGDILTAGYANQVTKTITLSDDVAVNSAYAQYFLWDGFENIKSIAKSNTIDINPEATVQLLENCVVGYMNAEFETVNMINFSGGTDRINHAYQLPYTITWDAIDGATSYTVELSTSPEYTNAKTYTVDTNSCDVINLFVGTRYYWRATPNVGAAVMGEFKTNSMTPRYITTESLQNVRDLGGWSTADGGRVKQGLIYRGCELNNSKVGSSTTGYDISDNDLDLFVNELGIKTEIDLRGESESMGITASPLARDGADVTYYLKSINAYAVGLQQNTTQIKEIFQIMADENNYPIYYHCWGGADRTGTVSYVLSALLGVNREGVVRDWELTSFSLIGLRYRSSSSYGGYFEALENVIQSQPGNTLQQKAENYLLGIGVTADEIQSIKNIMTE